MGAFNSNVNFRPTSACLSSKVMYLTRLQPSKKFKTSAFYTKTLGSDRVDKF